jgi:hypothetical protein
MRSTSQAVVATDHSFDIEPIQIEILPVVAIRGADGVTFFASFAYSTHTAALGSGQRLVGAISTRGGRALASHGGSFGELRSNESQEENRMKLRGVIVATAALGLLAAAPGVSIAGEGQADGVKCSGINGCSGQGECGAADGSHACKGKNACHGKGWVKTSVDECETKGGTAVE